MRSMWSSSQKGLNSFIDEQRNVPGSCFVTLVEFDNQIDTRYLRRPIDQVQPYVLDPRGSTSLRDAIGQTIDTLGQTYASLPTYNRPGQVFFVVNTDGFENTSVRYSQQRINQMISTQRDKYNWQFIFLAANQDAIASGAQYGFAGGQSMSYGTDDIAVAGAYASASSAVTTSRTLGSNLNFTDTQRNEAMGGSSK